jgi:UDP-N-acetylmuramoylalanine--D-glutamate ligase
MSETTRTSVVLGLGVTGLSCVRALRARGDAVAVLDTRETPPGLETLHREHPDVPLVAGAFDGAAARALLDDADLVAVSPGVPADDPALARARERGTDVAGDVELFAREARAPVAGITGTNGKSTVTSLLGAVLAAAGRRVAVGGNLGTPALDLLAEGAVDGYVLELSSFQIDLVTRLPLACAAVLNVSADHLDRYADLAAYAASKRRIYAHARAAVFNADDAATAPPPAFTGERIPVHAHTAPAPGAWGLAEVDGVVTLCAPDGPLLALDALPVAGRHNGFNVLAVLAMARVLGVDPRSVLDAVCAWTPLPHRCAVVAEHAGVRYVDDSKATNIGAASAALEGLDDGRCSLVLVAGGLGKGQDFRALREAVAGRVRVAVLMGRDAPAIAAALDGLCAIEHADDMDGAIECAAAAARPGDTVLLAPACASFDQFASYGARGDAFAAAVRARIGEGVS